MPAVQSDGWLLSNRYRVIDRVGAGGMAEVFRARDELLGRDVAVKVFRRELDPSNSAGGAQRQQIELQVLAQLSHPNLITLFDGQLAEAAGPGEHAYLVMELIDGPSLAARLLDGPLSEPEVRVIAIQVCDALRYVHGKGMVHRDVKPANILLGTDATTGDEQIRARLSDFGIVRLLGSEHLTSVDLMVGTASYLSPEQARGKDVGPAADVYALGLVLLEALTGERTYTGSAMDAVIARLDGPPPIPPGLPEPWPALLAAMTATEPTQRPAAAEVARVLRGDGGTPIPAAATPSAENTTVLAPIIDGPALAAGAGLVGAGAVGSGLAAGAAGGEATGLAPAATGAALAGAAGPDPAFAEPPRRRSRLPWLVGALALLAGGAVLLIAMPGGKSQSPAGPLVNQSSSHPRTPVTRPATVGGSSAVQQATGPAGTRSSSSAAPTSAAVTRSSAPPASSTAPATSSPAGSSSVVQSTPVSSAPATGTSSSTVAGGAGATGSATTTATTPGSSPGPG